MRTSLARENCAIARALDVLGDGWTMLVIREAFLGTRRFADFEAALGISKNVLSERLGRLVRRGILAKVDAGVHGRRYEYELTAKGKDLLTVITALRQWGDRWIFGEGAEPLLVLDRRSGRPIPRVRILDERGEALSSRDMALTPGPGATERTRARFGGR